MMNGLNVPKDSYKPNFQLTRKSANGDECFVGKFLSVEETYKQAVDVLQRRRNQAPMNYNSNRLLEQPIPKLPAQLLADEASEFVETDDTVDVPENNNDRSQNENDETRESNANENDTVGSDIDENDAGQSFSETNDRTQIENDPVLPGENLFYDGASEEGNGETTVNSIDGNVLENDNLENDNLENGANGETNEDQAQYTVEQVFVEETVQDRNNSIIDGSDVSLIDQKPDIENTLNVPAGNVDDIVDILDDEGDVVEDVFDEDSNTVEMTMTFKASKGFAMPLPSVNDNLIKRENDLMSGNLPFNVKKTARVYKIDGKLREIPNAIVNKFFDWSHAPFKSDTAYDRRLVIALLYALVDGDDLAKFLVSDEVTDFIQHLMKIRCEGDVDRLNAIQAYKDEVCRSKRDQM
ncbi:uncharacterized protein LOC116351780 [Contarinia nasturtii]|uniref:uncharacterized protein LOC116351780 n=1 Tax=Contarinia nasturtii TaxID=265458 RepID=UPI0012D3AB45|nr:uncharacterized protein LOC116351780 [Contarinia nasturtii]